MERRIVAFYDLSEEWQKEAKDNLDCYAEETYYLEPNDNENPTEHVLHDLSSCMRHKGIHEGFTYNGVITLSNSAGMLILIDDCFETAKIKIV